MFGLFKFGLVLGLKVLASASSVCPCLTSLVAAKTTHNNKDRKKHQQDSASTL